jgi:glutathione S-transferase
MKLYYCPMTRATRPRWLLEEIGTPYELVRVDLGKGEHKSPAYQNIHPHGQVPALVDGDVALFESSAICMYLADKFPEKKLAPAPGTPARGLYYQWMVYSIATAEPPVLKVFLNTVRRPEEERNPAEVEAGRADFQGVAAVLTRVLDGRPYLLGDQFTAADVMVGSIVGWARGLKLFEDHPALKEYSRRLVERPAYKRATAD